MRMSNVRTHWARALGGAAVAVIVGVGMMPAVAGAAETTTSAGVTIRAGANAKKDPNVAVLEYLPGKVTVKVDTPVTWTWKGTIEPHSVTFLKPGQTLPPPGSDPALFAPTPPTGPYDGTTFVNSGLQPAGDTAPQPFTMSFAKTGKYKYFCVIHPGMVGQVNVVDSGKTTSPKAAKAAGIAQAKKYSKEGIAAHKKLVKHANRSTKNSDGTRTWAIQMGTTTEHTDVLAFAPTPKGIKAGDSIKFVNNSRAPHTGTFPGEQPPITNPVGPQTDDPSPGPSPQTLNSTALFNTGLVPPDAASEPGGSPPPKAARSYTYKVPEKGKYPYYCILHTLSGMAGVIRAK
jgi:plastocyanin